MARAGFARWANKVLGSRPRAWGSPGLCASPALTAACSDQSAAARPRSRRAPAPSSSVSSPAPSSRRSSTSSAPAFDSGSLRLPHFGRLHAGRAAARARALGDQARARRAHSSSKRAKRGARDADAAGVAVVDEDRRHARLRVEVRRQAADVPAVAHRDQRQHGDLRVLGRVQRAEQLLHRDGSAAELGGVELEPQRLRLEARRRQVERDQVELAWSARRLALVGEHRAR